MKKFIKDGKVAVLIHSGNFGGYWATHYMGSHRETRSARRRLMFDPFLVEAKLNGEPSNFVSLYVSKIMGGPMSCDWEDVEIHWLPIGKKFYVNTYDGREEIMLLEDMEINKA